MNTDKLAATLQDVQSMLRVMTDNGLLDELTSYMHPDQINDICDRVDQAVIDATKPA